MSDTMPTLWSRLYDEAPLPCPDCAPKVLEWVRITRQHMTTATLHWVNQYLNTDMPPEDLLEALRSEGADSQ